jgi:hypothetical protein
MDQRRAVSKLVDDEAAVTNDLERGPAVEACCAEASNKALELAYDAERGAVW